MVVAELGNDADVLGVDSERSLSARVSSVDCTKPTLYSGDLDQNHAIYRHYKVYTQLYSHLRILCQSILKQYCFSYSPLSTNKAEVRIFWVCVKFDHDR